MLMPALSGPGWPFTPPVCGFYFPGSCGRYTSQQAFKEQKHFIIIFFKLHVITCDCARRFIEGAHLFFMLKSIVSDIQQEFKRHTSVLLPAHQCVFHLFPSSVRFLSCRLLSLLCLCSVFLRKPGVCEADQRPAAIHTLASQHAQTEKRQTLNLSGHFLLGLFVGFSTQPTPGPV